MRPPKKEKPSLSPSLITRKGRLGHEQQLDLYTSAKMRQEQVSGHMLAHCPDLVKQSDALVSCGSWLWFHDFFRLGKVLLRGGISCKQPLICPPCALRRSAALTQAYLPVIKHLLHEHPDWHPVLVTKTIRNGPDLGPLFKQFTDAHSALMRLRRDSLRAVFLRRKTLSVYASFWGGVGSYEYKRGTGSGLWHPHSHEIAFVCWADHEISPVEELRWRKVDGERIQVAQTIYKPLELEARLRQEWIALTGDSHICDIRMICWDANGPTNDDDALFGAVAEVMGYCLKMQDVSPADQVEAWRVLRTRRLTYSYGALRSVDLPPEAYDTDDTIPANEPWIEREYHWWQGRYNLNCVRDQTDALFAEPVHGAAPRRRPVKKRAVEPSAVSKDAVADWVAAMQADAAPF